MYFYSKVLKLCDFFIHLSYLFIYFSSFTVLFLAPVVPRRGAQGLKGALQIKFDLIWFEKVLYFYLKYISIFFFCQVISESEPAIWYRIVIQSEWNISSFISCDFGDLGPTGMRKSNSVSRKIRILKRGVFLQNEAQMKIECREMFTRFSDTELSVLSLSISHNHQHYKK